jgi:hypothetical protein
VRASAQTPQAGGVIQGQGDFSVNGQRTESNYYTIDGVSGNTGAGYPNGTGQNGSTGSIAGSTALGTTQSLVSVDALQEFRVTISTYSAEYSRNPGGQFSLVTRSGTNTVHGTLFEFLRNDIFDANDWFNNYDGLPRPALRQNDFGGTFGGPITIPRLYSGHDRSFFFISYEGLRLVQPVAATTQYVPSLSVRDSAPDAMKPLLDAFPLPTGGEITLASGAFSGLSPFVAAYSLPGSIDSTSVRVDHKLTDRFSLFARYGYTPTSTASRVLSTMLRQKQDSASYTLGTDWQISSIATNSTRVGFSDSTASQLGDLDAFGGAVPVILQTALGVPGSFGTYQYYPFIYVGGVGSTYITQYKAANALRQWNLTDTVALSKGKHQIRVGIDERHFASPLFPADIGIYPYYYSRDAMLTNSATLAYVFKDVHARPLYNQFAAFIQDEWRILPALVISAGLRWDVNPAPTTNDDKMAYTAFGDPTEPASLRLAPRGTPLYDTPWYNFAPRLGVAWTVHSDPGRETVVRTGGGVFFDTGNQTTASAFSELGFSAYTYAGNVSIPLPSSLLDFSTEVTPPYNGTLYLFPRHLQLPYTLQWNLSIDQSLGTAQVFTISYVGSSARRLLETQYLDLSSQNLDFSAVQYYPNGVTANYNALQLKFQRSVARGLQSLVSYTWSHSLDYGSSSSSYPLTYGNSDFDVRHNFQAGVTWDIPGARRKGMVGAVLGGWGLDGRVTARSAFPITLGGSLLETPSGSYYYSGVNYNPANPIYLYGKQYPGGRMINGGGSVPNSTAAFTLPTGTDIGNAARNFVRGFDANQVNFAARRNVHLFDSLSLQLRAEAFNIGNHPNFGYIDPNLTDAQFGQTTKMLNASLASMSSLYQEGGSRSMQFSLKLAF